MRNFWYKNQKLILAYVIPAIIGVIGLGGIAWLVFGHDVRAQNEKVLVGEDSDLTLADLNDSEENHETIINTVPVYVAGGVVNPGVYRVEDSALVADVIGLAGGFSSECDMKAVEQALNLADKVFEGMKIYVPRIGDQSTTGGQYNQGGQSVDGKTSINNASKAQLMELNGIGEAYSEKIIDARPYKKIDELISRDIIPKATYEKIKDNITL